MMKYKFLLFILLIATSFVVKSQDLKEDAAYYFDMQNYKKSYELYSRLCKQEPTKFEYKFRLGYSCLFYPEKKARAIEIFEDIKKTDKSKDADYYLAKAYHVNYRFEDAIKYYEIFIAEKGTKIKEDDKAIVKDANIGLVNCKSGKEIITSKVVIDIKNIGAPINTYETEGVPIISADGSIMIYTYVGTKSTGGLLDEMLQKNKEEGSYHEDIFISTKTNDTLWSQPLGISSLNTKANDAAIALSPDGQTLFLFVSDIKNPGDIYHSTLTGNTWSAPEKLNSNINSEEYWEGSCSISSDSRFLYFASERLGGFGGRDLYVSEKENGVWGPAKNLGPTVNTQYNEDAPYIHTDGITLFFSSEGHKSIGGYDIMYSIKKDNNWIAPINMGIPLNTTENDRYYVINAKGDIGYFSSNRGGSGGKGDQDIYSVTPGIFGEKPILALLKGSVFNDDKPTEAKIELIKKSTGEAIGPYYANSITGNYLMAITPGNGYKIKISVPGMDPVEDEIDIENLPIFVEIKKDFNAYSPAFANKKRQITVNQILDSLLNNITNAEAFNNDATMGGLLTGGAKTAVASTVAATANTLAAATDTAKTAVALVDSKVSEVKSDSVFTKSAVMIKEVEVVKPVTEVAAIENDTEAVTTNTKVKAVVKPTTDDHKNESNESSKSDLATMVLTPCSTLPLPDFAALKGQTLNNAAVYKQLLDLAGNICVDGLVFKIQIGAYRKPENYKYAKLKEFGEAEMINYPDGITRFTQLSYATMKDAEIARKKIIAKGQKDAWITAFVNGKRYTLEELIMLNFLASPVN